MSERSSYLTDDFISRIWAGYAVTLKSKRTKANYLSYLCCICNFAKSSFSDITEEMARAYFSERWNAVPRPSTKTMHTWLSCYRSIGRYMMENRNLLPELQDYVSPFETFYLDGYSDDINVDDLPTNAELERILETARLQNDEGQMYLMLLFAAKCAMTAGEIRSLKPAHIQCDAADRGFVVFKDKKRIHNRIVKIPDIIMQYLSEHADTFSGRESLFLNTKGTPLSERSMQKYVRDLMEKADVRKPYTLQDLRNLSIAKMLYYGASEAETAEYVGIEQGWMYRYSRILSELDRAPCDLLP